MLSLSLPWISGDCSAAGLGVSAVPRHQCAASPEVRVSADGSARGAAPAIRLAIPWRHIRFAQLPLRIYRLAAGCLWALLRVPKVHLNVLTAEQGAAVQLIAQAAVASQAATQCPAPMSAAQCIFESGYLARAPGNNCFGIKLDVRGNGCQYILTHEFLNGQWEEMPLAFETYATLADCFSDHARLLQSGVYEPAWDNYRASARTSEDLDEYIRAVSRFYATDPDYCAEITAEAHSATVQNAILRAMDGE